MPLRERSPRAYSRYRQRKRGSLTRIINEKEFARVARAIIRVNPHCERSERGLIDSMISLAHLNQESSYLAACGFELTFYTDPSGERACKASVSDILFK